jgi:hypothetical protein
MSVLIPVAAVPTQTLSIVLENQNCEITLQLFGTSLYFSLTADAVPIVKTRIARNKIRFLLDAVYKPFVGDFVFVDTQGDTDPQYAGLGTRYLLVYMTEAEVNAAG